MKTWSRYWIGFSLLGCLALSSAWGEQGTVPYPEGYRHWHHVKSMVIQPGHALEDPFGGIHHIYANDPAVQGLKTGDYPDGAVLVFDLLEYQASDNSLIEGTRKLVGVMLRDKARFTATGGWGFEGFAGDSHTQRLTTDGGQSCFGCHAPQESSQYVYSKMRN